MIVPGSNLLNLAMGPIRRQAPQWRAWVSRGEAPDGTYVSIYADPLGIDGSMQPVNRDQYQALGLNFEKNYSRLWTTFPVMPMDRDRRGDILLWNGKTWECQSDMDWSGTDGWKRMLCVEVPAP